MATVSTTEIKAAYAGARTAFGDGIPVADLALVAAMERDFQVVVGADATTAVAVGTGKASFRAPYAFTLVGLPRLSLAVAGTVAKTTVDIKKNGVSIFSTLLSVDISATTSTTAAVPAVVTTTSFADDDLITIDYTTAGTSALGGRVNFVVRKLS